MAGSFFTKQPMDMWDSSGQGSGVLQCSRVLHSPGGCGLAWGLGELYPMELGSAAALFPIGPF